MTGGNLIPDGPWPDDMIKTAVRMWQDGDSAGQIGVAVGKTRNSVIGKMHRLGLKRGDTSSRPKPIRVKLGTQPRKPSFNIIRRPKAVRPPTPPAVFTTAGITEPVNGQGVTLFELKPNQCHAVVHKPHRMSKDLPRYCGNPVYDETAYCEGHFHAYHQPPKPRVR